MKQIFQQYKIRILLVICLIGIIWYNSLQNESSSDGLSLIVADMMRPIFYSLGITGDIWSLNRIVRKLAHLIEFAILGGGLYTIFYLIDKEYAELKVVCIGSIIAICDELIQLFSYGRHASVKDVIIDTTGVILGIIVVRFGQSLYRRLK